MANTKKAKPNLDVLLASAKLPERTVPVCIRGDLTAEVERLERQLQARREDTDARLSGDPEARAIAEKIEALRDDMGDATVELTLRALPRREFHRFLADHQPRDDDAGDRGAGFNRETFHEHLVPACLVDPDLGDEQWTALADTFTAAQWNQLVTVVNQLNLESVSVPFSPASSAILQG